MSTHAPGIAFPALLFDMGHNIVFSIADTSDLENDHIKGPGDLIVDRTGATWRAAAEIVPLADHSLVCRVVRTLFRMGDSIMYSPVPVSPIPFTDIIDLIIRNIELDESLWIDYDELLEELEPSVDSYPLIQAAVETLRSKVLSARDMDQLIAVVSNL